MKTHTHTNNLYKMVTAILLTTLLSACIDEDWGNECNNTNTGDVKITLTLQLPATNKTRAMPADETNITQIQVLLFQPGDGPLIGNYSATSAITTDPYDDTKRSFTVDVIQGTFDMVVLANSNDIIQAAGLARDMSRTETAKRLQHTQTAKIPHNTNTLIPFWGEMKSANITQGSTLGDITMLRALAKIDIQLSDQAKNKFQLQTATLYHWQTHMALIPDNYNTTDKKVNTPTHTGSGLADVNNTITYTGTEIQDNEKIQNKIYLNETPNPGPGNFPEMPCLILGGQYGGQTSYYRVDLKQTGDDGQETHLHILRNHHYDLNITDILGEGSSTEQEAYEKTTYNIQVEVQELNDATMSNIVAEGQYYLKVSQATFSFDREHRDADSFTNDLTITTNHDDGWEITRITQAIQQAGETVDGPEIDMDNGWLRIIPTDRKGPGGETEKTIKLLLHKNETTTPRHARIHLQVGRLLDFIVKVSQSTQTILELSIEYLDGTPVSELFFYEHYGWQDTHQPQDIRVYWSPKGTGYSCNVDAGISGDTPFLFDPAGSNIATGTLTDTDGSHHYTISPRPFTENEVSQEEGNPFLHRGMRATFSVTDPGDPTKTISKTIYLRHQHIAIITKNLRPNVKMGEQNSFDILSNTSWEIERVENDGILATLPGVGTKGGNDISQGNRINFTAHPLNNDPTLPARGQAGRKATIYLRETQGYIPELIPFTLTAVYNDPNCYILNPAGSAAQRTVNIPIRKLFWAWSIYAGQDLGTITNSQLETGVVWDDVYLNTNLNANPQTYNITTTLVPDPANVLESHLSVTIPYNTNISGNAVVGVRLQGQTGWLYSWHIWITDYNPETDYFQSQDDRFMRRNLGALEINPNEHRSSAHGLFYQWGRKDPLKVSFASTSSPEVATANNLGNALRNPNTFYRAPNGYRDWFTNREQRSYQNDYLWNDWDNSKGIFDPCPQGWRLPGSKWEEATNQWSDFFRFTLTPILHSNGRVISNAGYDNRVSTTNLIYYHFAGQINYQGGHTWHTLSTNDTEQACFAASTPILNDAPSGGNMSYRTHNSNQANAATERANGTPARCVKEK